MSFFNIKRTKVAGSRGSECCRWRKSHNNAGEDKKYILLYVVVVDADSDVVADFDIFFVIMIVLQSRLSSHFLKSPRR